MFNGLIKHIVNYKHCDKTLTYIIIYYFKNCEISITMRYLFMEMNTEFFLGYRFKRLHLIKSSLYFSQTKKNAKIEFNDYL